MLKDEIIYDMLLHIESFRLKSNIIIHIISNLIASFYNLYLIN